MQYRTEIISNAIEQLPSERCQKIFEDRILHGQTLREIGDKFGITKERVRQIFNEAMNQVRENLSQNSFIIENSPYLIEAWRNGKSKKFLLSDLD